MGDFMSKQIFGLHAEVFLLWLSAFFYIFVLVLTAKTFLRERNNLMTSFFAFLLGMAVFHILLGAGKQWNNLSLIHLGSLAAVTGAAFTLKLPLSFASGYLKKYGLYTALAIGWAIIIAMFFFAHSELVMISWVFGYMILVSGGIAGLYIFLVGLDAAERRTRILCMGGGLGLITCCFFADILVVLLGVTILGEILMSAAPLIILGSFILSDRYR